MCNYTCVVPINIMNVLFEIIELKKIFMQFIIYFLTLNQMIVHIWTTNYRTNLVVCRKNSLCMRIAQATHVIISHHCKVMAILCVRSKSNFLAGDKFYCTRWCNKFDMLFLTRLKFMTRWQPIKHIATILMPANAKTMLMVEFS